MINIIDIGSVYSDKFKSNLNQIIDSLDTENYNNKLTFFTYKICNTGIKFREEIKTDKWIILSLEINDKINNEDLINNLLIKHEEIGDYVEKCYRKENCLGEYSEGDNGYDDIPDFIESLDSNVYLEIISELKNF